MCSHLDAETVGSGAFNFVWLVDSFWHGFILSLMSGAYYTSNFNLYALDDGERIEVVFAEMGHGDIF